MVYISNNTLKKIISGLILSTFFISILTSCGNSSSIEATDTAAPQTSVIETTDASAAQTELSDGLTDTDMDGFTLTFSNYDGTQYWWSLKQINADELDGTLVNDAIYERNRKIEERFNSVIKEIQYPDTTVIIKDVTAGETAYDAAMIDDQKINSCLTKNVLLTWDNMRVANLDNPWWNAAANEVFRIGDKQYAAVGDFDMSMYSKSYLIYFNKELYSTQGSVSDIYGSVSDGKWTYDMLYQTGMNFLSDLNGDSLYDENDQYGISGFSRVFYQELLSGAGVKYIAMNDDGYPVFDIPGNERSIDIISEIVNDYKQTQAYFHPESSKQYMPMFSSGNILFLADTMWDTETYRSYDIDLGMLPSPKYDEAQEQYYSVTVGGVVCALPKTLSDDRIDNIGTLLEAMAFASKYETLPVYKDVVLQTKYARDEDSAAVIDIIFASQTYDLGVTVWDIRGSYMKSVFDPLSDAVVSETEKMTSSVQKMIDSTVAAVTD